MYISITGLKPKGFLGLIRFWTHAIPSFAQVSKSDGIVSYQVKKINGYQCTLTAWESVEQMRQFMRTGAHLKAMKNFHKIAAGKTFGYESDSIPTWDEAYPLLQEKGRVYH